MTGVAVVTGAGSGVGREIARSLLAAGWQVALAGRREDRLLETAGVADSLVVSADVTSEEAVTALFGAVRDRWGRVDLLVNNAGIGWAGPIEQITAEKADELIAVNLTAPIQLTRLLVPGMAERRHGRIVFVSSIAGATGVRGEAVYAAAKAGLACFAESLSYELADRGVGVSLIIPGVVDTPFFERRGQPYERRRPVPINSERIAHAVIMATERDRTLVFVPRWMRFPVGLHGIAPGAFRALASRFG